MELGLRRRSRPERRSSKRRPIPRRARFCLKRLSPTLQSPERISRNQSSHQPKGRRKMFKMIALSQKTMSLLRLWMISLLMMATSMILQWNTLFMSTSLLGVSFELSGFGPSSEEAEEEKRNCSKSIQISRDSPDTTTLIHSLISSDEWGQTVFIYSQRTGRV